MAQTRQEAMTDRWLNDGVFLFLENHLSPSRHKLEIECSHEGQEGFGMKSRATSQVFGPVWNTIKCIAKCIVGPQ